MNTSLLQGGPDSQAAIDAERLVSRTFPDRRKTLDTTVDIDPTNKWLGEMDRRHRDERQFAEAPAPHSALGDL